MIAPVGDTPADEATVAAADGTPSTAVEATDATVNISGTTQVDIVVTNASGGAGSYEFNLTVGDPAVANVTAVSTRGDPQVSSSTVGDGGATVSVAASQADTEDDGRATVATVTVKGQSNGTTGIDIVDPVVVNESGAEYTITERRSGSITVLETVEPPSDDVSVGLQPSDATVDVDGVTTFDVVADTPETGVTRVEFDASLTAPSAARFTAFDPAGAPNSNSSTVTDSSISAQYEYQPGATDADDGTLGTITVRGLTNATTRVSLSGVNVSDDNDEAYNVIAVTSADLTVGNGGFGDGPFVSLRPADTDVPVGTQTSLDVVLDGADGGVTAVAFTVSSRNDTGDARVTDFDPSGSTAVQDNSVSASGVDASYGYTSGSTDADGGTLGTVTVEGVSPGNVVVELPDGATISDDDNEKYELTGVGSAAIGVQGGPPAVGANAQAPRDPDSDGLYEDVDGSDGQTEPTILDVIALLKAFGDDPAVTNNGAAFNFDGDPNDAVNILDVIALLEQV
jgi:hypothetical protein